MGSRSNTRAEAAVAAPARLGFPENFRRRRISKRRHSAKKAALPSPVAALPSRISRWMLDGGWIAVPGLRALADSNDRSWRFERMAAFHMWTSDNRGWRLIGR